MGRIVVLDSGPLGLLVTANAKLPGKECRAWLAGLEWAGESVVIPAVVDFEVRRELLRIGATTKLAALDDLGDRFGVLDISVTAFLRAAEFWAHTRRAGLPTAHPEALDADAILAGVAATIGEPWDQVVIATNNLGHFSRFPGIDARPWRVIS